jgi:cobalt-zinc-cadmium efflux system outer membrane protein
MLDPVARAAVACLIVAMNSPPALAQPAGDGALGQIDLPEALSRTLERSPELRTRGFEVTAAEGRLLQSTFRPAPELDIEIENALGTGEFSGLSGTNTTASLGWLFERGTRERIVDAARASVEAGRVEIEIAQLDAAAETARRYIDCLRYQAGYRNAEAGVALAREAVDAVRRRVDASIAREAEIARAEAALVRAELHLDDFSHELLSAYYRLSAQWGDTEPDFQVVAGELSGMPLPEPFESLLARVEQNPDLEAFVSQSRLAEAELNLARARSRPSWAISGGLRRIELADDWALVGGVTVPLRMGNRNQGNIAAMRATLAQVEASEEAARVRIETELFVLYQELNHNIELAAGLATEVAPRFETALADTLRAFELGRSSYLELRAVETELLDVAYEIIDARANAYRLAVEIERLTGESLSPSPIRE